MENITSNAIPVNSKSNLEPVPVEINLEETPEEKEIRNRNLRLLEQAKNEFNTENLAEIKLNKQFLDPTRQADTNFINNWEYEFSKLSLHNEPEENSDRTKFIEDIVKKTLTSEGKVDLAAKIRVVILNRGKTVNAFAGPDGTIFLYQSIIEAMDNLDSLMGIVFHELSHIENEDYAVKNAPSSDLRFVQEPAADMKLTTRYLDVAGFNTLGLDKSFKTIELKFGGTGKSSVYQEHAQRSLAIKSQVMSEHYVNDNKELTPIPELLSREVKLTNFEILVKIAKTQDSEAIYKILEHLSNDDIRAISSDKKLFYLVYKERAKLFEKRLKDINYTDEQIKYFLYCEDYSNLPADSGYITSTQELLTISESLMELEGPIKNLILFTASQHLYKGGIRGHSFLNSIESQMINEKDNLFTEKKLGTPLNSEVLIQVLQNYISYVEATGNYDRYEAEQLIQSIIIRYARFCVDTNEESFEEFFVKIKSSSLKFEVNEEMLKKIKNNNLHNSTKNFREASLKSLPRDSDRRKQIVSALRAIYEIPEEEEKKAPILDLEYVKTELAEILTLDCVEAGVKFKNLLQDLEKEFHDKNKTDADRKPIIQEILNAVDSLPFDDPRFFDPKEQFTFLINVPGYVKYGEKYYNNPSENPETTKEFMSEVREFSTFNLKLTALCKLYVNDNEDFYNSLSEIMENSKINLENLDQIQMMRLFGPLVSLDTDGVPRNYSYFAFEPHRHNSTFFEIDDTLPGSMWRSKRKSGISITQIQKLESLPFVKAFLKLEAEKLVNVSTYKELLKHVENQRGELYRYFGENSDYPFQMTLTPFEDDLLQNRFFRESRKKLLEMLETTDFKDPNLNLQDVREVIEKILPDNVTTREFRKKITTSYLDGPASFEDKVEFFKKNGANLTYDDLLKLTEQIKGDPQKPGSVWTEWQKVEEILEDITERYLSGEISAQSKRAIDMLASEITKIADITQTTISNIEESRNQSTNAAISWIKAAVASSYDLVKDELGNNLPVKFDTNSGLFKVTIGAREYFRSFTDGIKELQSLTLIERMYLVNKSLNAEGGLLRTDETRGKLGQTLRKSLGLDDPFIGELSETLTMEAKPGTENRDVYTFFAANILGQKLFDSFDIEKVDFEEVFKQVEDYIFTKGKLTKDEIIRLLTSDTRAISAQGAQYFHKDSQVISGEIGDAEIDYRRAIAILSEKLLKPSIVESEENAASLVPENIEVLFKGVEGTILGARSLQLIRQMRRFEDPSIDKRMALSFDANPGLDKFRFFKALSTAAKNDPELAKFLSTRLVSIEGKLGGGSMATTYKASVSTSENSNESRDVAIRALVPGAELQIRRISDSILNSLTIIENEPRKPKESKAEYEEKLRNVKLVKSIITLATDWCITDINDGVYEERDDVFRTETMQRFNMVSSEDRFVAPDRVHTSFRNWVRVEGLATGVTARKFLDDETISDEMKSEVVKQIILFNRYQYDQKPTTEGGTVLVQSDPSIGNYLVEVINGKPKIHVLDRGLMIPMSEERLEMMNLLVKGKKIEFLNRFLDEIIEYNIRANPSYDFLKAGNKLLAGSIKADLLGTIIPKVISNALFSEAKSMLDIVTVINDALIERKLQLPWDLQIPIKNMVGMELLMNNYIKKKI